MNANRNAYRAAHFLLIPELLYSPPNNAIINAYLERGYEVDVFAPGLGKQTTLYGRCIECYSVDYSWSWLIRNGINLKWFRYTCISGTSEDPLAIVGILSFLYGIKSFSLVDEIKAGSYRGDRSEKWKRICRWAIRRSKFQIVNDYHRVELLQDYVGMKTNSSIIVYPGCFQKVPEKSIEYRNLLRESWGIPEKAFTIGASGGFNMTAGADWLIHVLKDYSDLYAVIQPLGVSPLSLFLIRSLDFSNRIFIENRRLGWEEAWLSAQGLDVGLCVYTNPAPQFQKMGISSNRLCMFIAMGVPVIASKQESFQFLEEYDCGVLVSNYDEFKNGIEYIKSRHEVMQKNCRLCFEEYLRPMDYYKLLGESINSL